MKSIFLIFLSSLLAIPTVFAADELDLNAAVVTNYIFRGVSKSDNRGAVQAGAEYKHSRGLYVGSWATTAKTVNDSKVEVDLYAGIAGEIKSLRLGWDGGVITYRHNKNKDNFSEIYGSVSFDPLPNKITLIGKFSYDWQNNDSYLEALGLFNLDGGIKLKLSPGYARFDDGPRYARFEGMPVGDYAFVTLAVSKTFPLRSFANSLQLDIAFTDTNLNKDFDQAQNLWWLLAKIGF